jgi:hypothetical protein
MSWFLPIITNAVTRAMKDPSRTSIGSEAGQWPNGWPTITKCGRWNPPGFIPHTSSFERMLEHGAGELRRIGGFLGFHPTDDAIEEILAFLQIDHIRKATWQEHDNISFFRKVLPGIGKTTLQHRSRKTSRSGACIRDRGTGNGGVLHDGSDIGCEFWGRVCVHRHWWRTGDRLNPRPPAVVRRTSGAGPRHSIVVTHLPLPQACIDCMIRDLRPAASSLPLGEIHAAGQAIDPLPYDGMRQHEAAHDGHRDHWISIARKKVSYQRVK